MRFLVLTLLAALGGQTPPSQPPRDTVRKSTATASIGGRITDAVSGRPLSDAIVHVTSAFPLTGEMTWQRLENDRQAVDLRVVNIPEERKIP